MSEDYTTAVARRRLAQIDAEIMQRQANYASHAAEGDVEAGMWEGQQIADLQAQRVNVINVYNQEMAARNPAPATPMTEGEIREMSPERLAQSPEAIEAIFAKSKYWNPKDTQDPEFQRRFYAGMEEVKRRRRVERGG